MLVQVSGSLPGKLEITLQSVAYILPEIYLASYIVLLLLFGLIFKNDLKPFIPVIVASCLIFSLFHDYKQFVRFEEGSVVFFNLLLINRASIFFKILFDISALILVFFSLGYKKIGEQIRLEYYIVLLALVLGLHFLASSINFLSVYISIEMVSICSYILASFGFNKKSAEAGMKYLLFGAISSGIMLYGMSLFYGFTGTLNFTSPIFYEALRQIPFYSIFFVALLTSAGFLFKISSIPFHIWTPDIYQGAPTPVVAFFSIAPKAAGYIILLRFSWSIMDFQEFPEPGKSIGWVDILIILSILSMLVGNLAALLQKNAKRLLAYSSIAQAGFLMIGIISDNLSGFHSLLFYLVIYLFMNFAAFLMIQEFEKLTGSEEMNDYSGLGLKMPFWGVAMVIVMISLAGLPPTAGFTAKFLIFSSLWESYQQTGNITLLTLFVVGLANVVLSLFYYLKIPYLMFFKPLKTQVAEDVPFLVKLFAITLIIPLLFLFFKAEALINIINYIKFG